MANFPISQDNSSTLPNPIAGNFTVAPDHAVLHSTENDAIKALETKLGTGASTSTNNTFLIGNGTGTSAWSNLTSAQLAARVSDGTGSGSVVFGTSPTIVTPIVASFANANHTHQNIAGGGTLAESALGLTDITTNDVSISRHGFTPKAPNDTTKFLRGDASWALTPYQMTLAFGINAPVDATTYWCTAGFGSTTNETNGRFYITIAGTITAIYILAAAAGTIGTTETSTVSLRLNNTTDTVLSSSVVFDTGAHNYNATGLSIAVAVGDFIGIKTLVPAWATNPGSAGIIASVRIN